MPCARFWRGGRKIAWLNDAVGDPAMHAHLLEFDTVHGRWDAEFSADPDSLTIDGTRLPLFNERDPSKLPLDGVDVVIECTGVFSRPRRELQPYFDAGVNRVVVSAPVKDGPTVEHRLRRESSRLRPGGAQDHHRGQLHHQLPRPGV